MLVFIIRRLLYAPLLLFGVTLITFVVFNIVGGNPVYTLAGKNATPLQIHAKTIEYGFDRPLFIDADFLLRRWHAESITDAAGVLRGGAERSAAIGGFKRRINALYDLIDEEGEAAIDRGELEALQKDIETFGLDVAEAASASIEHWLNAISTAILDSATLEATRRQAALQVLRKRLRLAVPELVTLALDTTDPETRIMASYELDTLVYVDFAITAGDSQELIATKLDRLRAWWQVHEADYDYSFSFARTARSIFESQFSKYLYEVFTFDFGESYKIPGKSVWTLIVEGAPVSLMLTVPAFLFGTLLAVAIGLVTAFHQGTLIDRVAVIGSVMGMSVSILIFIILGQVVLAYQLGWLPVRGYEGLSGIKYFILPWILWIIASLGADVRFFRTAMVEELSRDYIRTARAKGLSSSAVMFKHLLKNAMIPILTYVIIALPYLYTGSLLLERYFGIPGLGKATVEAILSSDFPVIKALTLIGSILYIAADIITNIAYALVDPRVRLG